MKFFIFIFLTSSLFSSSLQANENTYWSYFFGKNNKAESKKNSEEEAKRKDDEFNKSVRESIEKNAQILKKIEANLKKNIVGQDKAIRTSLEAIERWAYGLNSTEEPIGALLYLGPTGVGKTELAKQLSKELSPHPLIRINMAEFALSTSVMNLIGSPSIEGSLTAALLKSPRSKVVLFDEIEKAHPSVQKALLQLLEEGFITDGKNKKVFCRDTLFILTSNLESQKILTMNDLGCTDAEIVKEVLPSLLRKLSPEFVNRLEPVIFRGFKEEIIDDLTKALLFQAAEEFENRRGISIEFDASVISILKCQENYTLGARPLKNAIKKSVAIAIMEAFKKGYFQKNDHLFVSHQESDFVIQTTREQEPFVWHCPKDERKSQPPFNFNDLIHLEEKLTQKVLGQPYPIKITVSALMRYAAGLGSENMPLGAFLYAGPTGVGKTELAKQLAKELMGSESCLIRFDMSSYSNKHSTWGLIGATFGYINYEEGGQLTEALKDHPYAILLLDEIEKRPILKFKSSFCRSWMKATLKIAKEMSSIAAM